MSMIDDRNADPAITLSRALELLEEPRMRAYERHDQDYDAWVWATTAVQQKRDWYREYNADRCAPWFDGSSLDIGERLDR